MKTLICLLIFQLGCHAVSANWKASESAAVFSVKPNQIIGSSFFKETLNTYGLIAFGYAGITRDSDFIDFQKEMGVSIDNVSEVTLVFDQMVESLYALDINQSLAQFENGLPVTLILRANRELSPNTLFKSFEKWANGPMFSPDQIQRFKSSNDFTSDKIAEMRTNVRIAKDLYAGMEKANKHDGAMLFPIPKKMRDQGMENWDMVVGIRAENGFTNFAVGLRKGVKNYFSHPTSRFQRRSDDDTIFSSGESFASFEIPVNADLLQTMGANELSNPSGPLGPLATGLGGSLQNVREVSGTAKFLGLRVHLDLVVACSDSPSAQSLWSVGQASLGMAQLSAMRRQMKNPQAKQMVSMDFLNRIKLKHEGNKILLHIEALPADLFPWAADKKFP